MIPGPVILFLDTNVLLHGRSLREIDWKQVANASQVRLVLCGPVLDELDEKKYDPKTADRARIADREITQIEAANRIVRTGVTLETNVADVHEQDNVDAAIIQQVRDRSLKNPGTRVALVTADSNMRRRCRAKGVESVVLDERWCRPLESDDAKKLRKAEQELRRLKNRQPQLLVLVAAEDGDGPADELEVALSRPKQVDLDALLIEEQNRYVALSEQDDRYALADVKKYNSDLEAHFVKYRRYLQQLQAYQDVQGRSLRLSLWIANEGTLPARDVRATISMPDRYEAIATQEQIDEYFDAMSRRKRPDFERLFGKAPRKPAPPEQPSEVMYESMGETLQRLRALSNATLPNPTHLLREPLHMSLPDPHSSIEVKDDQIHLWARKISHHEREGIGTVVSVFRDWAAVKPFEITYQIHTDDHPDGFEGRVLIKPTVRGGDGSADPSENEA